MLTNHLTRFEFNHIAWLLTKIATDIVVVVNLAQETDALRILSFGVDQMLALSNLAHLVFHVVTNREEGLLQLPIINLSQKIGLVFYRVRTCNKPLPPLLVDFCLGIMTRGD